MASLGKSTIAAPVLILSKLSLLGCWVYYALAVAGVINRSDNEFFQFAAGLLGATGIIIMTAGILGLGKTISVGLPDEKVSLKTSGIFSITRNPVYMGSHLLCAGSCLLTMNIINYILFAAAVIIHHFIILKEEEYLEQTFKSDWIEYKAKTSRYLFC